MVIIMTDEEYFKIFEKYSPEQLEGVCSDIRTELTCLVCGHKWWPRSMEIPNRCPNNKCNSRDWNGPHKKSNISDNTTFKVNNKIKIYGKSIIKKYRIITLEEQKGVCAICGKLPIENKKLNLDHDHETGQFRGLLCIKCNILIGWLENNDLKKAIDYIEKWDKIYEEDLKKMDKEKVVEIIKPIHKMTQEELDKKDREVIETMWDTDEEEVNKKQEKINKATDKVTEEVNKKPIEVDKVTEKVGEKSSNELKLEVVVK